MLESIRELFRTLYDVQGLIQWGGTLLVCVIVFVETGLFVGFFLPGDSLLVSAGILAAAGHLNLLALVTLTAACAVVGDQVGYWIGRKAGKALYQRENSFFFRKRHLEQAHAFYEKYGGKTIILARFVPIARTFAPAVAGAAEMNYRKFVTYNVVGGVLWVWSMVLGGYFLGRLVGPEVLGKRIHWVIVVVVLLSILPAIIESLRARRKKRPNPAATTVAAEPEHE